jgi:hypothetical protein
MISHSYIALIVPDQLGKDTRRLWMSTAKTHMPNGIHAAASVKLKGEMMDSMGYTYKQDSRWFYIIPTSRDLTVSEVQKIAMAWNDTYPDGDFEIDYSSTGDADERHTEIENNSLRELALAAAKLHHARWVSEQSAQGWRYGIKFNQTNKHSPLMMPWENLSARAKIQELKRFEALLEILNQMDLCLASKR